MPGLEEAATLLKAEIQGPLDVFQKQSRIMSGNSKLHFEAMLQQQKRQHLWQQPQQLRWHGLIF